MNQQVNQDMSEFLSVVEVAKRLELNKTTVYSLINSGKLPSQAFSKIRRVHRAALLAWIEERERAIKIPL